MQLCQDKRGTYVAMDYITPERVRLTYDMPLAEFILDFHDRLKSCTRGYASLDYDHTGFRAANLVKVDVLLQEEPVDAFSFICHADQAYHRGHAVVGKLKELIPRQLFEVPVQAAVGKKVIVRMNIKAVRKRHPREMLRRRHHPQTQIARKAKRGKEAYEAGGARLNTTRGLPRLHGRHQGGGQIGRLRAYFQRKMPFSSLYIHVPFCERKCNYCAFESAVPREGEADLWLEMLEREFALRLAAAGRPRLATCYFGGGTPTVLSGPQWLSLTKLVERYFDFMPEAEVTVEANPNSLAAEHLLTWRDWRVTRVSIGVQSFDDAELSQMGRLHSARQAYGAVSAALAAGFSVSADFIFGLPHQSFANWGRTLREAVRCGLGHISLYQLSLEEGTPWASLDQDTLRRRLRRLPLGAVVSAAQRLPPV